jgi:hypothetical protein
MSLPSPIRHTLALAAILLAVAPLTEAQVYKWVDDKGVVNYGNKPPATSRGGKAPSVVEDRVSVYSPDPTVVQATQNARDRSGLPSTSGALPSPAPPARASGPAFSAAAPTPPPTAAYDPCANPADVSCVGSPGYDGYARRHRPPNLVQPQLQPGAIAGNVNAGNGYIPGLSSQAQPPAQAAPAPMMRPRIEGASGFGNREDERGRGRGR